MERRYHNLRRKLDQQGYKQYFDVESIDLVEKLYIELNQAKNGKLGNNGLTKGNADLQREIVKIKSEHENRIKVLNEAVRKQENEIYDLQFLNNQYSDKIQQLEEESKKKSERLHELEKNIHPTIQISEVDSVVPPSFNGQQKKPRPAQHNADQLKRLQLENDAIKNQLERANELIASLKDQMDGRGIQKDKLSKILRNDQAARGDLLHPCSDHLVAHLTFEMEHLQRLNYELEKRLKDVINTDKESQLNEHRHLSNKNKLLELNLADADQHAEALRKQKEELLAVADKEMNEAKVFAMQF